MTAGPVQAEAFREIVDTFFRAGTEDDDRSSQFVGDDFGNVVNGLRIQPDGTGSTLRLSRAIVVMSA